MTDKFLNWMQSNLTISRFPLPSDIMHSDYDIIINVSDEYISMNALAAVMTSKILHFWFPMNEVHGCMGLNSLYGALQVLWASEEANNKVMLHCHAGANRSQTVADAYYFLRTGKHRFKETPNQVNIKLGISPFHTVSSTNKLMENCDAGLLPPIRETEKFIMNCSLSFRKEETRRGGMLDKCKAHIKK